MSTTSGSRPGPQQTAAPPAPAKPAPVPTGDPDFNAAVEDWRRRAK